MCTLVEQNTAISAASLLLGKGGKNVGNTCAHMRDFQITAKWGAVTLIILDSSLRTWFADRWPLVLVKKWFSFKLCDSVILISGIYPDIYQELIRPRINFQSTDHCLQMLVVYYKKKSNKRLKHLMIAVIAFQQIASWTKLNSFELNQLHQMNTNEFSHCLAT